MFSFTKQEPFLCVKQNTNKHILETNKVRKVNELQNETVSLVLFLFVIVYRLFVVILLQNCCTKR